jgi:hypothetical protein
MQKKWRRHVACVIFTAFFIALTSLTVHYSESPFFGFAIAILAPSPQIALSSLIEALPPIMLSIAAGCLGAVYGLLGTHTFEETANLRPELNGTPEPEIISDIPIWYTSVVVILLAIPPITLGLMAVQGFLPGMYRFAYGGIAGPVVLNSLCRHGQLPQRNFTKGAYFTVLILLVFFVVLGLPEMAFFTQSGFFSR